MTILTEIEETSQNDELSLEHKRVALLVKRFLSQRHEYYNDVPEVSIEQDEFDQDHEVVETLDERNFKELPETSGHDCHKFILVSGKPGTGKSFPVKHAIRTALQAQYCVLCSNWNVINII